MPSCRTRGVWTAFYWLSVTWSVTASGQNVANYGAIADPLLFLVREPAVQEGLSLSDEQKRKLIALNEEFDPVLLAARNWQNEKSLPKMDEIRQATRTRMGKFLSESQQRRLRQIAYRIRGIRCVLLPEVAKELQLTTEQSTALQAIVDQTDAAVETLRGKVEKEQTTQTEAEKLAREVQAAEQAAMLEKLTDPQKEKLVAVVGPDFDLAKLGNVRFKAPDIEYDGTWINSPSLQLDTLRGKVVVVHFFAFGCINCIHNYPWYREWDKRFDDANVRIVGVHTPETSAEQDIDALRAKIKAESLLFPIVCDQEKKIWDRWGNSMWPSVYVIDKQGKLRYWWYGELNWQNAGGQTTMAQKIAELVAESPRP